MVFKITTSGTETVLYSFAGGNDGGSPTSRLIDLNHTLYGTTGSGGADFKGTIFSLTSTVRK
jgi:hypothetical protein